MNRFRPSQFTVKLGEWDLKDNDIYSQEFRVVEITAHPDFKANGFYNDLMKIMKVLEGSYMDSRRILKGFMGNLFGFYINVLRILHRFCGDSTRIRSLR